MMMKAKFLCKIYLVVRISTDNETKVKEREVVCAFNNHPDASVYCDELFHLALHTEYLHPNHFLTYEVECINMNTYENNNSTGDE